MSKFLVTVISGTRVRFFTLEQAELPKYETGPNLIEREDLSNPDKELPVSNMGTHAYGNRRKNHLEEIGRHFIQMIADQVVNLTQRGEARKLILIAEPQLLGSLRNALMPLLPRNLHIQELAKDLSKLKPLELHEYLATRNLLPARKRVFS
jgi:protein required for attachment to host cells